MVEKQSHYLAHKDRLIDLVAAIQVLGTYRFAARTVESWAEILGEKPRSANSWVTIFNEHPEFFRASIDEEGYYSLALRRAQARTFNTRTSEVITVEQFRNLPDSERAIYSRKPLTSEQILSLVEVAVKIQDRAVARRQELRWWVQVVITTLSSLVGALIAVHVK